MMEQEVPESSKMGTRQMLINPLTLATLDVCVVCASVGKCSIVTTSSKDGKMGRGVILSSPSFSYFPDSSNLCHSASSTI